MFSPPYRSTLLCSNVVKFVRREIGEIVRYLFDQNNRLPLKLSLVRGWRPKSARASLQQCAHSPPAAWNSLPSHLHSITDTVVFTRKVKTKLFAPAFDC